MCDNRGEPWREYFRTRDDMSAEHESVGRHIPQLGLYTSELTNLYQQCACKNCKGPDFVEKRHRYAGWDSIDQENLDKLADDQYFLCSRLVYGYVLRERKWRKSDLNQIHSQRKP